MDDADDTGDEPRRPGPARPGTQADSGGAAQDGPAATGPEAEFRALAEDWIAIWQSEITAYLTDPETQQAWGAMMAVWAGAAQAMMRAMPPTSGFGSPFGPAGARPAKRPKAATPADERRAKPAPPQSSGPDAAPRAAPAAAAPVARDDEVRRLEQRVAELERQLADQARSDQDRRRGTPGENRRPRRTGRPRG